jgi:hypothetical protein
MEAGRDFHIPEEKCNWHVARIANARNPLPDVAVQRQKSIKTKSPEACRKLRCWQHTRDTKRI